MLPPTGTSAAGGHYRDGVELGLRGRVAVVTGASRGIGRAVAEALGAEGCDLVLCGRDTSALDATVAALARTGVRVRTVLADLTDPASAPQVVDTAVDGFGRLDVLVNNAGGNVPGRLLDLTDRDWRSGFDQNFFAPVRLALACVPTMQQQGRGRIINVASTFGREPDPLFGPYSAAKAALINVTKNLANAFTADGVLTTCLIPGVTLTDGVATNAATAAARLGTTPEDVMARMMARDPVPAGRFGTPAEVAAAVVFLASEAASWISGACLAVDGGTLRAAP